MARGREESLPPEDDFDSALDDFAELLPLSVLDAEVFEELDELSDSDEVPELDALLDDLPDEPPVDLLDAVLLPEDVLLLLDDASPDDVLAAALSDFLSELPLDVDVLDDCLSDFLSELLLPLLDDDLAISLRL